MPLFSKKKTDAAETTVEPGQEEWRNWKPSNEKGVEESTRHTENAVKNSLASEAAAIKSIEASKAGNKELAMEFAAKAKELAAASQLAARSAEELSKSYGNPPTLLAAKVKPTQSKPDSSAPSSKDTETKEKGDGADKKNADKPKASETSSVVNGEGVKIEEPTIKTEDTENK